MTSRRHAMHKYNILNQTTSEELKSFRKELKLTQKEFADFLGVSKSTVERMEKGSQEITGVIAVFINTLSNNIDLIKNREIPDKTLPTRMWYMYKNKKCTLIDVDDLKRIVTIKNYEQNIMFCAFGANQKPSYEDYEEFLKSRCFPPTRDKIKIQLEALGVPFYEPRMIIEKTKGRMAEDDFWIQIER